VTLDATPNLLDTGSGSGQLANAGGWSIKEYQASGTVIETSLATGTWASNLVTLTFSSEEVVSKGTTSYYVVQAPISYTSSTDTSSLSVRLASETSSITRHSASGAAASATGGNVWSDRSASSHSLTSTDWTNSYKLETLPASYAQLSES
jgi:hypothetical protein